MAKTTYCNCGCPCTRSAKTENVGTDWTCAPCEAGMHVVAED